MGKATTRIVYKPDTQSTDEYTIIVEPEQVCHIPIHGLAPLIRCSCSTASTKLEVRFTFNLT
jgi:hypothetical protein